MPPADSRLNTRPSAVICAATHPRYEIRITIELKISTPRAVAAPIKVADRQQLHLVQLAREEHADQDQADARAERIFDRVAKAALDELRRNAEHRFGAEPGREGGRDDHEQRQRAAGQRVVRRLPDARVAAYTPIATETIRYSAIKPSSVIESVSSHCTHANGAHYEARFTATVQRCTNCECSTRHATSMQPAVVRCSVFAAIAGQRANQQRPVGSHFERRAQPERACEPARRRRDNEIASP